MATVEEAVGDLAPEEIWDLVQVFSNKLKAARAELDSVRKENERLRLGIAGEKSLHEHTQRKKISGDNEAEASLDNRTICTAGNCSSLEIVAELQETLHQEKPLLVKLHNYE
ncbi:hypothetical protein BXZ70DRAFT_1012938 [Cristinia sonorae]|uniref:Uncharacterized protein n=1 Tax=Cristinia sonorae TaxID=1940300 RepID=A0A8K0XKA6_9AGAR|nr:hypothetical protein BXZ70DRAFT_1012938 [Cristinia sonorae]